MLSISTLLAASLPLVASAASQNALVYTFDSEQQLPATQGRAVSSDTAQLILASRLGFSSSASLGYVTEDVANDLNRYGGRQSSFWGSSEEMSRLLVILEGVDLNGASYVATDATKFSVSRVPDDFADGDAVESLLSSSSETIRCTYAGAEGSKKQLVLEYEGSHCPSSETLLGNADIDSLSDEDLVKSITRIVSLYSGRGATAVLRVQPESSVSASFLSESLFEKLASMASESKQETTLLLLPSTLNRANKTAKGKGKTRAAPRSEPVSLRADPKKGLLSTMMPVCYVSNATCTEATNGCSGHGYCYRRYGSKSGSEESDCFACKCSKSVVRKNPDGSVKTVQWGGPACQKKDVSTPFFLLGGFTIVIVAALAWGVGLLYSIGQEELPSVIAAGVQGARAAK